MIERRRMARPHGPSITLPSESGPRWTSVSFIAASAAGSGAVAPSRLTRPHIPHMRASLERGSVLPLAVPAAQGQPDDPGHRRPEHAQIEADRAVGDVLEVMDQLVLPGVLAGDPGLGEAGNAGPDDEALPVLGDFIDQPEEEGGPYRARADHAHVAPEHVEELRHLVDVGEPGRSPHQRHLLLGAAAEILPIDVAESTLRSPLQRPQLEHGEDAAGPPHPFAAVENRGAGGEQDSDREHPQEGREDDEGASGDQQVETAEGDVDPAWREILRGHHRVLLGERRGAVGAGRHGLAVRGRPYRGAHAEASGSAAPSIRSTSSCGSRRTRSPWPRFFSSSSARGSGSGRNRLERISAWSPPPSRPPYVV